MLTEVKEKMKYQDAVNEQLKRTIKEFEKAFNHDYEQGYYKDNEGREFETFMDWLDCNSVGYSDDDYYRAKRLTLSWGGLGSESFLFFENIDRIEYHYTLEHTIAVRVLYGKNHEIMNDVYENYL